MEQLRIQVTRGSLVESVHRVSAAVVDSAGTLRAASGDPDLVTFWRSAAKPFQAIPLIGDGVLERFGLGADALALACASHSSEPMHLALVDRMLQSIGCTEDDLACGVHLPLGAAVARKVAEERIPLTPRWNNCSGKHAGMLALARHHGWSSAGYQARGHPVQDRILGAVCHWTGLSPDSLAFGVDGCTAVNFGLPLRRMALAWARLGSSVEPAAAAVREAMMRNPALVAGAGRFCTELMEAMGVTVLAKVGAGGVYCAALPGEGLGIALKIEDGDMPSAPLALLEILRRLGPSDLALARVPLPEALVGRWERIEVRNTRGGVVGSIQAAGALHRSDPAR